MNGAAKYSEGQLVLAVRGPGSAMEAERRNIGKVGEVVRVAFFKGCTKPYYEIQFKSGLDSVDESCLMV